MVDAERAFRWLSILGGVLVVVFWLEGKSWDVVFLVLACILLYEILLELRATHKTLKNMAREQPSDGPA